MGRDQRSDRLTCVDLWRTFGNEYKIVTDPAYDPTGIRRVNVDPWYFTIPCKFGTIWENGGDTLAVDIDYHDQIANKVRAIPGVTVKCDGDREKTFLFPLSLFARVARLVQPRRRRRMTPEQRAEAAKRLAKCHL